MIRVYIRKKNEASGHVFKSKTSVKDDEMCVVLNLYISESEIDGRTKVARNMKPFSWQMIQEMKANKSNFRPMGYLTISNLYCIQIEISNCGSCARYRMVGINDKIDDWHCPVSEWSEIRFTKDGEAWLYIYGTKRYLSEFQKI